MSELAVRVEGLGKEYRLGGPRERYSTLRDRLNKLASAPFKALRGRRERSEQNPPFWALKEVSFEVRPGEVVGIIGRNGAGKSTLLKVLSRITEPTEGEVDINGRVGSLLEVGTGFHPELTGRENVYLNGAILGMRRSEITRKFDEIVAFAGVEKFIDTPVKHYSSGMYMRLAFAVAAHLEPEILVVDEVLAVGDAEFQKKCLGKMSEVARRGRTVLFVSHNMAAVKVLCTRCICLVGGQIAGEGAPDPVIRAYLARHADPVSARRDLRGHPGRTTSTRPVMTGVALFNEQRLPSFSIPVGHHLAIEVEFSTTEGIHRPVLGIAVKDQHGVAVTGINNRVIPGFRFDRNARNGRIVLHYSALPLGPGLYHLDLYFGDETNDLDIVLDAISFEVVPWDMFGSGKLPPSSVGPLILPATWELFLEDLASPPTPRD